ncbi:ABC transporter related [Gluconacetobacter diazotrophicus PA1 5]|uniref:ABC transporter ATP-binding protein n=1 Tax=Gluconacetobacter diazotrophicus TaxID=33996 RepID=A0A7W4FBL5_GLUDI|nr:ABC transporter ATP-binding protein [Gluconacetobacter diazotrophicus]ACI50300.1 ABC transporter related [Gluconacetobacter diazotrophicus PA1 5]MBB2154755.1 ABC transporter ATP-binding protein [Gluconacetobacter diazotrophicus]
MASDTETTIPDDQLVRYLGRPLSFIFRYMRRHAVQHVVIFLSVAVAVACTVGATYATRFLVDTMTAHGAGEMAAVWRAVAILVVVIAFDNLSWRVAGWFATYAFVEMTGDVRRDLFRYLTGHSASYFADRMPGAMASRISTSAMSLFTLENLAAWNVLPPCLNVALSIGLLLTISPLMAGVIVALSGGLCLLMFRMAAGGRGLHQHYAAEASRVDGEMLDIINNVSLVRSFGMTHYERLRLADVMRQEMGARGRSLRYMEKLRLVHAVLTAVLTAGLLAWVVLLWQMGRATIGDVVMVANLGFMILHGTRDLAVALVETIQHIARLDEALSAILVRHEMVDSPDARGFTGTSRGEVAFRDVTFAYPGARPVLSHFNLEIAAGSRVGLVGRSGSGKSTILALIQRLRYVQGGAIEIDGIDIRDLDEPSLRACMSVVPQDVSMLRRSVLENIRYGKPDATDEEVLAAAAAAGCRDFIDAMPEGFQTEVGDRGVKLSGGQRQRIAIARAFLRNAPILILDEATSALDSESEQHVQAALDRLKVGRTVIAVAHRLSTLRDFDRIVVMDQGRIVQDGPVALLERSVGPYRDFLERQSMTVEGAV